MEAATIQHLVFMNNFRLSIYLKLTQTGSVIILLNPPGHVANTLVFVLFLQFPTKGRFS